MSRFLSHSRNLFKSQKLSSKSKILFELQNPFQITRLSRNNITCMKASAWSPDIKDRAGMPGKDLSAAAAVAVVLGLWAWANGGLAVRIFVEET